MQRDNENERRFSLDGQLLVTAIVISAMASVVIISLTAPSQMEPALSGLGVLVATLASRSRDERR